MVDILTRSDRSCSSPSDPARMIADNRLTAIMVQRDGLPGGRAGAELPHPAKS